MNSKEINDKLQEINIENHIWIIYLFIIIASWYSNSLEKEYFLYQNTESKNKYRNIINNIFTILIIIYLYFFKSSIDDINNLKATDSEKKRKFTYLSSIGSTFVLISGIIFLYIAKEDEDIDVEIAFN